MKSENHIVIHGWMRTELNLKGNDLLVYAVIYGFSQTDNQRFTGSLQYLADWCGATKQGISKNIKNLIDAGLLQKFEYTKNGVKFCEYSCIVYNSVVRGMQLSLTNNIDNNIDKREFISKDINSEENRGKNSNFNFGKKAETKPSLYSRCISMIDAFIVDNKCVDIREALIAYLNFRLEVKDKPLYINMWKGMLKKLEEIHAKGYDYSEIIQFNLLKGYLSFYEPSKSKKYERASEPKHGTGCKKNTAEEDKQREVFLKQMQKEGKRVAF